MAVGAQAVMMMRPKSAKPTVTTFSATLLTSRASAIRAEASGCTGSCSVKLITA